jgi:hypothetical protein
MAGEHGDIVDYAVVDIVYIDALGIANGACGRVEVVVLHILSMGIPIEGDKGQSGHRLECNQ